VTRRLAWAFGILLAVVVAGTVGYMIIEGWGVFDSLYMTVITVRTVGFREVHPLSRAGQMFTIALILAGVGALGFALGQFVEFLLEGHLPMEGWTRTRRRRRCWRWGSDLSS
jgi:voltage-gated potassium channel